MIKFKSNVTWSISNKEKAEIYKLEIIKLRDRKSGGVLRIDLADIPEDWSLMQYIDFLVSEGVIVKHIRR